MTRPKQLFTKTQVSTKLYSHVWGLTPAQCWKVKEVGDVMTGKLAIEALVNGSCNYNGPKVAKFVVK